MGKGNDLRDSLFGGFVKYLKVKGIDPDTFGRDVWMTKCWDMLYGEWVPYDQKESAIRDFVNRTTSDKLEDIVKQKKDDESKQAEDRR